MSFDDHHSLVGLIAILASPIAIFVLFSSLTSTSRALIVTILGAQMLLPVGTFIKIPMVPQLDKTSIASFSALLALLVFGRRRPEPRRNGIGLVELLIILYIAGPIITSTLNSDAIVVGDRVLPGVGLYDALSAALNTLVVLIPFFLGRRFLNSADDCRDILRILAIAGLLYSIPLLFEIRFSPQLHYWIYGYYSHEFVQAMRDNGFRPMVFMGHGLLAAFFLMTSGLAAAALSRAGSRLFSTSLSLWAAYLDVVLWLCKSLGALVYGIAGTLLVGFTKPGTQIRVASLLVTISLMYPLLRTFELLPTDAVLGIAKSIDADRAGSLEFRFNNEDMLARRALERPLFGWGRFGRSRIFDADNGSDVSVTDGRWIIDVGQFGIIGFLSEFGLLSICVYRAASALRYAPSRKEQQLLAALALIVSLNIFDLIPNSSLVPWTWLISGALLGRAEDLAYSRTLRRQRTTTGSPSRIGSQPTAVLAG